MPCLIFDNTDHFSIPFQENVFQFARSIYESEFCVTIMPLTDKTSWQLSKSGALQSFENEALSLPIPSPKKVLDRRISYLKNKITTADKNIAKSYFLTKGIMRLSLDNISAFAANLNEIFINTPQTSKWIGGLANNDIRRLLELTKDTITSPHIDLDDLLKAHVAGRSNVVPLHKIIKAIINKRYDIYPVGEHSFVQNLFSMHEDNQTSPLLALRIIQYLRDIKVNPDNQSSQYVPVSNVAEYFSNMGINKKDTDKCLENLLSTGLVLNYDPTVTNFNSDCRIELSPSGKVHLEWATSDEEYISIMKDITCIRDESVVQTIRNSYRNYRELWHESLIGYLRYLTNEDEIFCTIPEHSSFVRQKYIIRGLNRMINHIETKAATLNA